MWCDHDEMMSGNEVKGEDHDEMMLGNEVKGEN